TKASRMAADGRTQSSSPTGEAGSTSADDIEKQLTAELAPQLQVVRRLGRGSMASVYLAREQELKRLVAIKILAPRLAKDQRARQRFEREAQAVASLSHPNIVSIHSVGRLPGDLPYIVMQYVKGTNMADRLQQTGKLPVAEAERIVAEVASAVAAAHLKGIVHRDIRPANVIYDEETGKAMLSDFGIAAILATGETEQSARLTQTGELIGNPAFMSPEQLLGNELTERSDVYGLGLLAFQLLTGRGPYDAASNRELLAAHVRQEPRKVTEFRVDASPELSDLVNRCLAKEPGHRPTAADVARRLHLAAGTAAGTAVDPHGASGPIVDRLTSRRLPQIVAIYVAGGFGLLELIDQLVGHAIVPELTYQLTLVTYLFGIPAVLIITWFHGKKGTQRFSRLEYWLYGGLGLAWLGTTLFVLLGR
ncbi:MAG: serine/threonine-protein kinase, partial [Gemmatimonadota bacterium]